MSRQATPLAAHLDAVTDTHHAGVCKADVALLQEIGEELAHFSEAPAAKLSGLSDGRMVTRYDGRSEIRRAETFTVDDLFAGLGEGALGLLDTYPVIRTSAALYFSRPAHQAKAA